MPATSDERPTPGTKYKQLQTLIRGFVHKPASIKWIKRHYQVQSRVCDGILLLAYVVDLRRSDGGLIVLHQISHGVARGLATLAAIHSQC